MHHESQIERLRSEAYIISVPSTPPGLYRPTEYRVERIYRDDRLVSETVRDENGLAVTTAYARELLAGLDAHLLAEVAR